VAGQYGVYRSPSHWHNRQSEGRHSAGSIEFIVATCEDDLAGVSLALTDDAAGCSWYDLEWARGVNADRISAHGHAAS
jgi:hypothetical protein